MPPGLAALIGALPATPRAIGFWDWSVDVPCLLVLALGALYVFGSSRTVTPERTRSAQRVRHGCFFACLATLEIALASPIDPLSDELFWVHMIQHTLLIMLAAPLLVVSAPWLRLWRGFPLGLRRWLARGLSAGRRTAPLRALSRGVGRPLPSFVIFSVVLLAWHLPGAFDATLSSSFVHATEHTLFFITAVLFWKQSIPSAPLHIRLDAPRRVFYLIGGMIVTWALAVVLALAPHPLYSHYAHLATRPGGISALADQQLAAGVMWVPGSVTFLIVLFVYLHRWLTPASASAKATPGTRLASEH